MIRGLEDDETEFLDLVAKQQQEINKKRFDEENKEIKSFRVSFIMFLLVTLLQLFILPYRNYGF